MTVTRFTPRGYRDWAVYRRDIDVTGATGEYRDLLEKTVSASAHARYLTAPLPESRVGVADAKLLRANPEAKRLLSSWLRGQMEHLASHLDALRTLLVATNGETPYSTTAPHMRAVIEDAADILLVMWAQRKPVTSLALFGRLAIADLNALAKDADASAYEAFSDDLAALRELYASSVVGTYSSKAKRSEYRSELRKPNGGAPPRLTRIQTVFVSREGPLPEAKEGPLPEAASVWRRLSADSHYSPAWDQHFSTVGGPVDRAEDLQRSFRTMLAALEILLPVTREMLEEPTADKNVERET